MLCRSDANVVDEAHGAVKTGGGKGDGGGDFGNRLEGFGIDEFEVVDLKIGEGLLQQMMAGSVEVDGGGLFAVFSEIAGGEEGAANSGGVGAVFGGKLAIAGGEGEAVGFPNGGMTDDFNGDIEIPNHASNEGELLEVFVTEDGEVRLEDVEKLEDNGEDTIEVTGAGGSAKVFGEEGLGDEGGVVGGVEAGNPGNEGEVDPFFFAEGEIFLEWLGVIFKVFGAVELDGVDEDGDGDGSFGPDLLAGGSNELEVAFVESSHGRDEGERAGGGPEGIPDSVDV